MRKIIILVLFVNIAWSHTTKINTQLINLNFQSINVRSALHILAEFAHVNIVLSDAVQGKVTLRLQNVTWQNAMSAILHSQGLVKTENFGVIMIDQINPATPKLQAILLQLNYAKAHDLAEMLQNKTQGLLSSHGAVNADPRTNTLWIQDLPTRIKLLQRWIRQIDIPNQQVIIEARLVNMSKNCAKDLGARLGISKVKLLSGRLEGGSRVAQGETINTIPLQDRLNVDLAALPLDAPPVAVGIALARLGSLALLDIELSALESTGMAEIIASPRLMTTNQHPALIESGEDIPYQETSLNGATSVAFKKAVLRLKVTPQITPEGRFLISLLINQDSDSGRRVQGVPILLTKTLETNVLINNGETIVLGGIYKQEQTRSTVKLPIIGAIPIIGKLFSRKQTRRRKEELLIFITPHLVKV